MIKRTSSDLHKHCAPGGIRTPNLLIRSQMLYPLSYGRLPVKPTSPILVPRLVGRQSETHDPAHTSGRGPAAHRPRPQQPGFWF